MAHADIEKLKQLVIRLRSPDGCPWDREQTLEDFRAYLLEEAHETAAAIDTGDRQDLREELGDLIFQVVFVARLAEEEGAFELADAIDAVHAKMIERHPHVFGDHRLDDAAAVLRTWERRKASRRQPEQSLLAGIPASLPPMTTALRIGQKAAGVGFDWQTAGDVLDKVHEELKEVDEAVAGGERERCQDEIGDLMFTIVNLARHLGIDPDTAMAGANRKFRRRFETVESAFADRAHGLADASFEEMEDAWHQAKRADKSAKDQL